MKRRATSQRNITRYDRARVHGFLVRFKRGGRTRWKWFLDSAYGGPEGARRTALAYWKRMLLKLPVALRVMRRDVRNKTGVVGVHLDWSRDGRGRKHWSYRASWPEASGRTVRRCFSISKYAKAGALALAAEARRGGIRRLEAAKRAELRREVGATRSQTSSTAGSAG